MKHPAATKSHHKKSSKLNPIRRRSKPGASPGVLVQDPEARPSVLEMIGYNLEQFKEIKPADSLHQMHDFCQKDLAVRWLNVEGLADLELIRAMGQQFQLHPLALEDVVNVHQRPKLDDYGDTLFLVARMPRVDDPAESEQVSFFLGPNFVLTFQEGVPGDCFNGVRERLRQKSGRIRSQRADYLLYALLDALIDYYFPVLENYGEKLELIEEEIINHPYSQVVSHIYGIRRHLLGIRRAIWPLRDVLNALMRESTTQISDDTRLYLRDCYDHVVQLIDLTETYRDIASNLMEVYLSSASNRMNEIMKFLTIMSSIFAPLTFIAGIYGMNFKTEVSPYNLPELTWYYGYPLCLLVMLLTVFGMLIFFRYKRWLGVPTRMR